MSGNKAEFFDYVDLALLRLAKLGRAKLASDNDHDRFYEEFFTDLDFAVRSRESDPRTRLRADVMRRAVAQYAPQGASVIDVGCGLGDNLLTIYRPDLRLVGIDYSSASSDIARRHLGAKAEIRTASATAIPFEAGSFSFATCIEVLEHLADHEGALREINRVLKPDGVFLVSVPYRHWFRSYYPLMGHLRHYTRRSFSKLLEEHGFTVLSYLPNYPSWNRYANYCYIACRLLAGGARVVGAKKSPTDLRLPLMSTPLLDSMLARLQPLLLREEKADYSTLETSTFVLARKTAGD